MHIWQATLGCVGSDQSTKMWTQGLQLSTARACWSALACNLPNFMWATRLWDRFSSSWTLQHSSLTIGLSPCQSYVCLLGESVKTQKYRHCDKLCAARLPVSPSACPDVCKPVCPHVCCILAELGDALCMYHNCKSNTLTLHLLYPNTGCIPICWYQNVLQKIIITFSTNVLAWLRRGSKMSYRQQFDGRMAVHFSSQKQYHHSLCCLRSVI